MNTYRYMQRFSNKWTCSMEYSCLRKKEETNKKTGFIMVKLLCDTLVALIDLFEMRRASESSIPMFFCMDVNFFLFFFAPGLSSPIASFWLVWFSLW